MRMSRALQGIVFDLDGTLRVPPSLDLRALLARMLRKDGAHRSAEQVQKARQTIESALVQQQLGTEGYARPGAKEVCDLIDQRGLQRAIITLSSRDDAEHFQAALKACSRFFPIYGKEYPSWKPSPDPLLHVCEQWGVEPEEVLMVGDSPRFDVACGNSAGTLTCLVDPLFRYKLDDLPVGQRPTFKVDSLHELKQLIENNIRGNPSASTCSDQASIG